jgi:hypothetical protein
LAADVLADQKRELALDRVMLLDGDGRVLASTEATEGDVTVPQGFFAATEGDELVSGGWVVDGHLVVAALAPLVEDFELVGSAVVARELGDERAEQVARQRPNRAPAGLVWAY